MSTPNPLDDPRVEVDEYVVYPTGYADLVHSDKDMWCLTVVNGHAYGWSIRRGMGNSGGPMAMNRRGEWIIETACASHDYLGWRDGSCACSCGRRFDSVQDFTTHVFPPGKDQR